MLLRSLLLLSAIFLSSCGTQAPKPPIVEECSIVAVEGVEDYLYCKLSDGSAERWRVKIKDANKYICTTPEGYVAGKTYEKELNSWISQHCKQ